MPNNMIAHSIASVESGPNFPVIVGGNCCQTQPKNKNSVGHNTTITSNVGMLGAADRKSVV